MSGRGIVWRTIASVERVLPSLDRFAPDVEQRTYRRRRLVMALGLLPLWLMPVFDLVRDRGATLRAAWPTWRTQFEGLTLVFAVALLTAAAAAGVTTWYRETRARRAGL